MVKCKNKSLTPKEIVAFLDQHIVGQAAAKRAVAIALRNRWRRSLVKEPLRSEIQPKNLLLIGPTGVGKTEIARRVANLENAPFIKIEATKFTEIGYVGRDVESIIRDLLEIAIKQVKEKALLEVQKKARKAAVERILEYLAPIPRRCNEEEKTVKQTERANFEKQLIRGELDEQMVELDLPVTLGVEIMAPPGMEEVTNQLQQMLSGLQSNRLRKKKMKIGLALQQLTEEESLGLINEEAIRKQARDLVEQNGIVFLDELDKIVSQSRNQDNAEISREGVQRDLLPLVEGTAVNTKYGTIKTDHILFIAAGAFHLSKPSDLIPELQGRFPVRVELSALSVDDLTAILTQPKASLVTQYSALMQTEGVKLTFTPESIKKIAEITFSINDKMENIGARRLYTVMEQLLEEISFNLEQKNVFSITAEYVENKLKTLLQNEDLSRYIL